MVPFVAPVAGMIATELAAWPIQPKRLLDIAAGHGLFGISAAQAIPSLEVTAIDWPGSSRSPKKMPRPPASRNAIGPLAVARSMSTGATAMNRPAD